MLSGMGAADWHDVMVAVNVDHNYMMRPAQEDDLLEIVQLLADDKLGRSRVVTSRRAPALSTTLTSTSVMS